MTSTLLWIQTEFYSRLCSIGRVITTIRSIATNWTTLAYQGGLVSVTCVTSLPASYWGVHGFPPAQLWRALVEFWFNGMYRQSVRTQRNVFNNLKYDTHFTLVHCNTWNLVWTRPVKYLSCTMVGAFITTGFHVVKNRVFWLALHSQNPTTLVCGEFRRWEIT